MSRYQKGKTNLDFTEARDSEWQWHQLGYVQVCISLQTDNHASTTPLKFFTGRMPLILPPNQQRKSTKSNTSSITGSPIFRDFKLDPAGDFHPPDPPSQILASPLIPACLAPVQRCRSAEVVSASIQQVPARPARIRSHIATSDKLIKLDLHQSWPQLRWENLPTPARR